MAGVLAAAHQAATVHGGTGPLVEFLLIFAAVAFIGNMWKKRNRL